MSNPYVKLSAGGLCAYAAAGSNAYYIWWKHSLRCRVPTDCYAHLRTEVDRLSVIWPGAPW